MATPAGLEQSSLITQTQRSSVCARNDSICAANSSGSGLQVAMQTADRTAVIARTRGRSGTGSVTGIEPREAKDSPSRPSSA